MTLSCKDMTLIFSILSYWLNGLRLRRCKLMSCLHQPPQVFRKCIRFPFELDSCLLLLLYCQLSTNVTSLEWKHSKAGKVMANNCTNSCALDKARTGWLDPLPTTDSSPRALSHPGEVRLPSLSFLPTPQHCQERGITEGREAQGALCNCEILQKLQWKRRQLICEASHISPTRKVVKSHSQWQCLNTAPHKGLHLKAGESGFLFGQLEKD